LSWGLSGACDTGEAREESPEEGESEDGSGDVGIDGDGAIDGTQDNATNGTVDAALDEAGECRWGDWDEDLMNMWSVSLVLLPCCSLTLDSTSDVKTTVESR